MQLLEKVASLAKFYFQAKTYKRISYTNLSDFVFSLLEINKNIPDINKIEILRKKLKKDNRILKIKDLGAGSTFSKSKERSVKSIAKSALSPKWQCEVLYNIINQTLPQTIVEIGTSLGISTAYLAKGNIHSTVHTMEGAESIATVAMENFASLNLRNVKLIYGNFDNSLPVILKQLKKVDFAFIDGNHKKSATLNYFNQILNKSDKDTLLVFDDIHWSRKMTEAWEEIKSHNSVTASLDFYSFGIIFFDEKYTGNFKVISNKYKFFE